MKKKQKSNFRRLRDKSKLTVWWGFHRLTAPWRSLPSFLIVGVMKGGTTSLFKYLVQHPAIYPPFRKEIKFFDCNYVNGFSWYQAHFPMRFKVSEEKGITGDASPYYIFHPLAHQRIKRHLPQAKIIILLRNPVDRAFSHYQHMLRTGREKLSFADAVDQEEARLAGEAEKIAADPRYPMYKHMRYSYLARGRYIEQIERLLQDFPTEQLLILQSENLYTHPSLIYQETLDFLGLPSYELKKYDVYNEGSYDQMSSDLRIKLLKYFKPYNEKLFGLLGERFAWDK